MSCFAGFKLEILFSFLAFALLGIRLVILPLSQASNTLFAMTVIGGLGGAVLAYGRDE